MQKLPADRALIWVRRPFDLLGSRVGHLLKLAWNLRFTFQRSEKALGPVVEVALSVLRALEAQPLEHLLRMSDPRFDLPLPIGVAYAARQRERAVVREDIAALVDRRWNEYFPRGI